MSNAHTVHTFTHQGSQVRPSGERIHVGACACGAATRLPAGVQVSHRAA